MSRRLVVALFAAALFALTLTACQTATAPTPVPEPVVESAEQVALIRTAWTILKYGVEEEYEPVPGSNPSVEFGGIRYSGFTGCNYFLGTYDDTEGPNSILMKFPSVTVGECADEALLEQQLNFFTALTTADEYRVQDGQLILSYNGTDLMTMDELEPAPFEGTEWIYRFEQGDTTTWQAPLPGTTITAVFDGQTVSGNAGCNDYSGTYTLSDGDMTISDITVTDNTCTDPEGVMDQESRYLEWLQSAGSINQFARSFELRDTEDLPLMLFSAD